MEREPHVHTASFGSRPSAIHCGSTSNKPEQYRIHNASLSQLIAKGANVKAERRPAVLLATQWYRSPQCLSDVFRPYLVRIGGSPSMPRADMASSHQ